MLRRNFLQLLSALPLLGWLKPEPAVDLNALIEEAMIGYQFTPPVKPDVFGIPYYYSTKPVIRSGRAVIVSWRPGLDVEPF